MDGIHKQTFGGTEKENIMLYVSVGISGEFEKAVGNDTEFSEYKKQMAKGFGTSLDVTRRQIVAVLQREGIIQSDVAFGMFVDVDGFMVEVYVYLYDDASDKPTTFFPLLGVNGIKIPFGKWRFDSRNFSPAENAYFDGLAAGEILAADFGREGLPTEAKKAIAELARIFRKSKRPSNCPQFNWVTME